MNIEEKSKTEMVAAERIEEARKTIAKFISNMSGQLDMLDYSFSKLEWNDDVLYDIRKGLQNLGTALAAFDIWYDDDNDENASDRILH